MLRERWKITLLSLCATAVPLVLAGCPGPEEEDPEVTPTDAVATPTLPLTAVGCLIEKDLFVKGTFTNNWNAVDTYKLTCDANTGIYSVIASAPAGAQEFKIADANWSAGTDFGATAEGAEQDLTLGVAKTLADRGKNIKANFSETCANYKFAVQVLDKAAPILTVTYDSKADECSKPDMTLAKARWISTDKIVWPAADAAKYELLYSPTGAITMSDETGLVLGGDAVRVPLTRDGSLTSADAEYATFPYLGGQAEFKVGDTQNIDQMLKGQLVVVGWDSADKLVDVTSVQSFGVIDERFYYGGNDLGLTWAEGVPTLKLWAPTAQSVKVHVFDTSSATSASATEDLVEGEDGVWSVTGEAGWKGKFYRYEVGVFVRGTGKVEQNLVTDPYSLSLSTNSLMSQFVDLNDSALKPEGWDGLQKPALEAPEDIVLYELHVRDFSAGDTSVPEAHRGKFLAFTDLEAAPMSHLSALADSGLTHIHLLPSFDIATINEDPTQIKTPTVPDEDPDSDKQQEAVMSVANEDAFNWGYDPYHYTVPEGSYSTNADGSTRILEFRQMVKALSSQGLRTVMDVVYNHTNASGQTDKSVLDKVVPGYYHRLDDSGYVLHDSCCQDTATENRMMEKLMIDSLLVWAKQYKVDGFRFDLMGFHTKANMVNVRAALDSLTVEKDGVDGKAIYVYGEAWKFGTLQSRFPNDAFFQANTYGTGIGSFNDRIRDSIRGGSPFSCLQDQGFTTGMWYDDNGSPCDPANAPTVDDMLEDLLNYGDNIRVSMAGGLKDYEFMGYEGELVTGADVVYRGTVGSGYTADPQEIINYVDVHDNQTLWDNIQAKAPFETTGRTPATATLEDRIRMSTLSMYLVALGEGVPIFHAGSDMLRSKSGDKDSYNSGDWFNKLDFTFQSNNWGVGLPPKEKNESDWEFWGPRLADATITPSQADITDAFERFQEALEIRKSSILFRLRTADQIQERVFFLNAEAGVDQIPGLIVMQIKDFPEGVKNLDKVYDGVVSLFNATDEPVEFTHDALKTASTLHPVQQQSVDPVVKLASCGDGTGTVTVPPRTALVCVAIQELDL